MTEEILLGDYKLTLWPGYNYVYGIYLHNERVGRVYFKADMSLHRIYTNDTDLITMLLLRYQVSPDFKIYPYEIILGESSFLMICHYIDQMTYR